MPRTKKVSFVSVAHHERMKAQARAEVAALETALNDIGSLTDHMLEQLRGIARESKRTRKWRKRIADNKNKAVLACGREGCRRLVVLDVADIHAQLPTRVCPECYKEDRRAFRVAASAINLSSTQTPR